MPTRNVPRARGPKVFDPILGQERASDAIKRSTTIGGGGGGSGTVTSLSAGAGITLTPNPITTTGIIAVTNPFDPTVLDLYTKLAGRPGTANDTLLSTDGDGTLTGSGVASGGLILQSSPNAAGGATGLFLVKLASPTEIDSTPGFTLLQQFQDLTLGPGFLIGFGFGEDGQTNPIYTIKSGLTGTSGILGMNLGFEFRNAPGEVQGAAHINVVEDDSIVTADGAALTFTDGITLAGSFQTLRARNGGTLHIAGDGVVGLNLQTTVQTGVTADRYIGVNFAPNISGTAGDLIAVDVHPGLFGTITGTVASLRSTDPTIPLLHTGFVRVGDASNAALLKLADAAGHDTILTTQTQAGDITYALPATSTAGQLTNDGAGTLSWQQGASGPSFMGMLGLDGDEGPEGMPIPGSPGAAGTPGATGSPGVQGIPGIGLDGADGDDGLLIRGDQGIQGPTGAQGPPGFPIFEDPPDGEMGAPGLTGQQGIQGLVGPQGLDGDVGDDGMPIPGNQGSPGAQGPQGMPGIGLDGEEGPEGLMIQGTQGSPGATGQQGIPGIGLDGEEGPEGLMIQGNQGSPGATGSQGIPGVGLDGSDGDDGLLIQGNQGIQGPTGAQGPAGVPWLDDAPGIEIDHPISFALSRMRSLDWFNLVTDPTGTGAWVFGTAPTFTTSITDPLLYGGTTTGSTADIRASSAANYTGSILLAKGAGDIGSTTFTAVSLLGDGVTVTPSNLVPQGFAGIQMSSTITQAAAPNALGGPALQLFVANYTHLNSGSVAVLVQNSIFYAHPTLQNATSTNITDAIYRGLDSGPTFSVTSSGTILASEATDIYSNLVAAASATVTTRRGLRFIDATGAGAVTNQIAVDVPALAKGGTLNVALRSAVAAGSTNYALKLDGTAQSLFGGKITTYNNITTAGFGISTIVAAARSTAQTAAVASVATFTPGADGTFLVSANVLVTTATAHTFTVTVSYKDEGNTSRTLTLTFSNVGGTLLTAITNAGGTVPYEGIPLHIRAKSGTAITIATTGTFTTVTYNVDGLIVQVA